MDDSTLEKVKNALRCAAQAIRNRFQAIRFFFNRLDFIGDVGWIAAYLFDPEGSLPKISNIIRQNLDLFGIEYSSTAFVPFTSIAKIGKITHETVNGKRIKHNIDMYRLNKEHAEKILAGRREASRLANIEKIFEQVDPSLRSERLSITNFSLWADATEIERFDL